MAHPVWSRIQPIVDELDRDPLYRASGAAMELFHSNVIAWALRTHPEACAPLAKLLGFAQADEYDVRREWLHIDLAVAVSGPWPGSVIENKITARSEVEQLERYQAAVKKAAPDFARHAAYTLLSLVPPVFELPTRWKHVDYVQVSAAMGHVADRLSGFDADFTRRYAHLTRLLADLAAAAGVQANAGEPYFLDAETERLLRIAGVRDLVLKLRNADLVQQVVDEGAHGPGGWHEVTWATGQPIASRFTREHSVGVSGAVNVGWQLQGRQLRLAVIFCEESLRGRGDSLRLDRENAAKRDFRRWLDTDKLEVAAPGRVLRYAGKLDYNHYAPDFVYRYGKLRSEISSAELIQALARLSRMAEQRLPSEPEAA